MSRVAILTQFCTKRAKFEDNLVNNAGTLSGSAGWRMTWSGTLFGLNKRFFLEARDLARIWLVDESSTNDKIIGNQLVELDNLQYFYM